MSSSEAPFVLQENGQPVFCPDCKGNAPLTYPGIQIPDGPPRKRYLDEARKLILWTFNYQSFCLKHAIKRLKKMKEADLKP